MPAPKLIVILGLTDKQKPVAARFDLDHAVAVRKAAALMGLQTGIPKTEEAEQLAAKLPAGKLFAAGRGLVPLVKVSLYDELRQKLELEALVTRPVPVVAAGKASPSPASTPTWADLKVGSTVLAQESDPNDGWWKAVITAVSKDGTKLTIRWLDAPKQPQVIRKRLALGLLLDQG